jgi:hypothetical protein
MKYLSFTLILFFSINHKSFSQSLIAGIPSADVAEKNHLEITHETQLNFWKKPTKWNSFNFLCYGIGGNSELTLAVNNLDNESSKNLALGFGAKRLFPVFKSSPSWEHKFILGSNVLYSTSKKDFGIWSYGLYSLRVPKTKSRFTGGLSYGTHHTYGYRTKLVSDVVTLVPNNIFTAMVGFEQPITKRFSIISDWYSGSHAIAALITAFQYDFGKNVLIGGYKIANNKEVGSNALIVELMISIPTKKESH